MTRVMPIVVLVALALAGCWQTPQEPLAPSSQAPAAAARGDADYLSSTAMADEAIQETESAVESALAWSEKYSQAVEKLLNAQQDNRKLQESNREASAQISKLQAELDQSQKELGEANAMLMELRQELEKWKKDVLGFRQEMRSSQEAQLEALTKVLKLLGGEVVQPTTQPAGTEAQEVKEVASG